MPLDDDERTRYDRDGYFIRRALVGGEQLARLRAEIPTIFAGNDEDGMHREREFNGAVRQVYLAHRHSGPFRQLVDDERVRGPVQGLLGDGLHIYHSKINAKDAFDGGVWLWHQDFGYWFHDGVEPSLVSVMVLLDRATIHNGALKMAAGSHRWGRLDHVADTVTSTYKQWCVPSAVLKERLREEDIHDFIGEPGDALFFHCNLLHGSGHNMSPLPRVSFVAVYNSLANKPRPVGQPRPDWVVDRTFAAVAVG